MQVPRRRAAPVASLLFPGSSINWSGKISPRERARIAYHPRASSRMHLPACVYPRLPTLLPYKSLSGEKSVYSFTDFDEALVGLWNERKCGKLKVPHRKIYIRSQLNKFKTRSTLRVSQSAWLWTLRLWNGKFDFCEMHTSLAFAVDSNRQSQCGFWWNAVNLYSEQKTMRVFFSLSSFANTRILELQ